MHWVRCHPHRSYRHLYCGRSVRLLPPLSTGRLIVLSPVYSPTPCVLALISPRTCPTRQSTYPSPPLSPGTQVSDSYGLVLVHTGIMLEYHKADLHRPAHPLVLESESEGGKYVCVLQRHGTQASLLLSVCRRCRHTSIMASAIHSGSFACLLVIHRPNECISPQLRASSALSLITWKHNISAGLARVEMSKFGDAPR